MCTPRGVLRHDDLRHLVVDAAGVVGIRGAAHDDEEVRRVAVRREPLVAVDDPLVAVEFGAGLDGARVRTGVVRLGHGEAGLHAPFGERNQPLLVLLRTAVLEQDLLVAGVRRHHAEQRRRAGAVGEHFVHVGVLHEGKPHAAELRRQVRRPQLGFLDFALHLHAQLVRFLHLFAARASTVGAVRPELALVGQNVVVDDLGGVEPHLVDFGVQRRHRLDVHGHGAPPRHPSVRLA